MKIEITNDPAKRVEQAKAIVAEKNGYYTPSVLAGLRKAVEMRGNASWSKDYIEDVMYDSIYYYWAYGSSIEEYFYYEFAKKTHDEIREATDFLRGDLDEEKLQGLERIAAGRETK